MGHSHGKVCGRCGATVCERHIAGKKTEACICLVKFDDELMPDAWHFRYESQSRVAD